MAKSILIIGGGPTACEFAGEIMTETTPETIKEKKTVTIVTSGDRILHSDPIVKDKLRAKLVKGLEKLNVDVIYNERVKIPEILASGYCLTPMSVTTESGKTFDADCVFTTIGNAKYNSDLIKSLISELELSETDAMNDKGQIKVKIS